MMMRRRSPLFVVYAAGMLVLGSLAVSCSTSKKAFDPNRKYAPQQLQQDYTLFRKILEEQHPSLYWFTPKDSMDYYFNEGYNELKDSMTERHFKSVLTYVAGKIRCGHTSVKYSKDYDNYLDTAAIQAFPLSFKIWPDTAVVVADLIRQDTALKRGTVITRINGRPMTFLCDTLLDYIAGDGYSMTGRYQSLSNLGTFGALYHTVFGLTRQFRIGYLDRYGQERETVLPLFNPRADTTWMKRDSAERAAAKTEKKVVRQQDLYFARNVQVDTTLGSAYMSLNTFTRGDGLKRFFRHTFRALHRLKIPNLVVDVRVNGGGDASNSTLITRYLIDHKFKIADSLYAIRRSSRYSRYIHSQKLYWLAMLFITRKHADGYYHFGYLERHYFKPKKRFHYNGHIYILTGGNSFSAATLFAKALKGQDNVTIVGEETGGGAYGNTAWIIPDVTLPHTGVRFRLPKFRLVMDSTLEKAGRGVMPDVQVSATVEDIQHGVDPKIRAVRQLIEERNRLTKK